MRNVCVVEDCGKPRHSYGWCQMHHKRFQQHGDPLIVRRAGIDYQVRTTCTADDCETLAESRGYCQKHYIRWQKYGDTSVIRRQGIDFRVKKPCIAEGCGQMAVCRKLCQKHYLRLVKHGNTETVLVERATRRGYLSIKGLHSKIKRERGVARDYACVDCGQPAAEWSYDNADPEQLTELQGGRWHMAYSLDVNHYDPRCISCHRTFDFAHKTRNRDAS